MKYKYLACSSLTSITIPGGVDADGKEEAASRLFDMMGE